MKRQLLGAPMLIIALVTAALATPKALSATPKTWPKWTTAGPGLNLNGKMFTLSSRGGGVTFYSPDYSRISVPLPSTTLSPNPTTIQPTPPITRSNPAYTYPPWSTPPATRGGVSVCLRCLIDQTGMTRIFTLSPSSSSPLLLSVDNYAYRLSFDRSGFSSVFLRPNILIWSDVVGGLWTRVCLTVDSVKNVVQVFSGSNMSIRKMLPKPYVWSGEPVIDFSGFDGQLTDVQMWNYPLRYTEVYNYMSSGYYGSYQGSALTWSYIRYSFTGYALLEDAYEQQAKQPISRRSRARRPKGKKMVFNLWEKEGKIQLK